MAEERFKVIGVDENTDFDHPVFGYDNVITIPRVFIEKFNSQKPYQIWYGSRFSGKSWTKALQLLLTADSQEYFRGLFARRTQKEARDSQFQLFRDTLDRYPLLKSKFKIREHDMMIQHIHNGNFLKGASFEQPDSLMSVPDLTEMWIEEPITHDGQITRHSFLSIAGTLRNPHGLPSKFHFTLNPVGKNNFIYEDFFDPIKLKYDDTRTDKVLANYYHNVYCPQDRIDFLGDVKKSDYARYRVDGLGEWGEPTPQRPFFYNFSSNTMVSDDIDVFLDEPLLLSFDFNVSPATCLVIQFIPPTYGDYWGFHVIQEFQVEGGTEELCNHILSSGVLDHEGSFNVTGDRTGHNRSSASNRTNYDVINDKLGLGPFRLLYTEGRNNRLVYSRDVCNYLLSHIPVRVHSSCRQTVIDLISGEADTTGSLVKSRDKNHPQDCGDAFRYAVHAYFPGGSEEIKLYTN